MAKARKLPSGAWQTRATKVINGEKVTKSFTVNPKHCRGDSRMAKAQSELLARKWVLETEELLTYGITVGVALEKFVDDRAKVLSPSTIVNYRRLIPLFSPLAHIYVNDIKTPEIQALINEWAYSVKTKTIQNRISFLLSALDYAECDKKFRLRYPQTGSKEITSPDIEDIKYLLENASADFRPVIYLAAFGTMRRGEISALKEKDIVRDKGLIHIHADMVLSDNGYVYKPFTKTGAIGTIPLPRFIIDSLPKSDDPESFVFDMNPNVISHRFDKLKRQIGFQYNFHSLRHFAASFRSDLNVPMKYIEEAGRWKKGSTVLSRVYDNSLDSNRRKYAQIVNEYIEKEFQE